MISTNSQKILIIEDDKSIQKMLKISLQAKGYQTSSVMSVKEGITETAIFQPDLILLDLQLPDGSGMEVVHNLRGWSKTPIIVVSVISKDEEKISLLDAGADDYVTKPFSMGELLARIRANLRNKVEENVAIQWEDDFLKIDIAKRMILKNHESFRLTPIEFQILYLLVTNLGKIITYEQIMKHVWGESALNEMSSLRVHMTQLRKKIQDENANREYIQTIPGVGFIFLPRLE